MHCLVLVGEVVMEINTLFILKFRPLLLLHFLNLFIVSHSAKAQESVGINDRSLLIAPLVEDVDVRLHFVLGFEGHVTL